jgi:DNA-binding beta-propeller fold protein YncE
MKRFAALLLAVGVLSLAGCTRGSAGWDYETVSGPNDRVLNDPISQGWEPIGISVTHDGTKWFVLKRQKATTHPVNWQYKTVTSTNGEEVLNTPSNQGWEVVGVTASGNGSQLFLLKKAKT